MADLYDQLWKKNLDIANDTLKEDFLQRMQGSRLSAERYMTFSLQDIYYLVEVTAMLKELKENIPAGDVKSFFEARYKSYQDYANNILKEYNLKDASNIIPCLAITSYLQSYRDTMKLDDPIYFAVAMLPCERLWPYLAQHLDIKNNTAYFEWKRDNLNSNADKVFRPLLKKYAGKIDQGKAMGLFRQHMEHEHEFFKES